MNRVHVLMHVCKIRVSMHLHVLLLCMQLYSECASACPVSFVSRICPQSQGEAEGRLKRHMLNHMHFKPRVHVHHKLAVLVASRKSLLNLYVGF